MQIEEVPGEMTQEDLATDDVMILDTWDQVTLDSLSLQVTQTDGHFTVVLFQTIEICTNDL